MKYVKAVEKDINQITVLVQETIQTVYPKYYPKEVVDFFCKLHSRESIAKDIEEGFLGVLEKDGVIIGTGCYKGNHITRVYVLPEYQGMGYGSYIIKCLENNIRKKFSIAVLDASLPAVMIYEKHGYKTIRHDKWCIENDVILVYDIMEKELT